MDTMCSTLRNILFIAVLISCAAANPTSSFKALTFNLGLLEATPLSSQIPVTREARRDNIIAALQNADADLVCIQEAWFAEDVKAIVDDLSGVFSYSHSKIHFPNGTVSDSPDTDNGPLCDAAKFTALLQCVAASSCGSSVNEILACGLANCLTLILDVFSVSSEDCLTCFTASYPNINEFFGRCAGTGPPSTWRRMNAPGLLLLAKDRLTVTKYSDFFPGVTEFLTRGYLTAKINNLQIVCTHLSAGFEAYPEIYLPQFTSYTEKNLAEVAILIEKFGNDQRLLLLGDFNAGEAGANGIENENPASYSALTNKFITTKSADCTFCPDNLFTSATTSPQVIDHCFGKNVVISDVQTTLPVSTSTLSVLGTQLPFSDHEAVTCTICMPRICCH